MASRRGSLDRRILTSIFWVGTVPMALAIVCGYFGARALVERDAKSKLAWSTEQTAAGLRLIEVERMRAVKSIAALPAIAEALASPEAEATLTDEDHPLHEAVLSLLQREASVSPAGDSGDPPIFNIYSESGEVLLSTGPPRPDRLPRAMWVELAEDGAAYVDYLARGSRYLAEIAAPVRHPISGDITGFITQETDLTPMLNFAFGMHPYTGSRRDEDYGVLLVHSLRGRLQAISWREEPGGGNSLSFENLDPQLVERLNSEENPPETATFTLERFKWNDQRNDAFLAYSQLFDREDTYVVAFQPKGAIFRSINTWTALVTAVALFIIGLFYFNAYRNVHNNIVRPISLLNEGAQIIGQGDLKLKLKIGTGDEIEELAQSFNRMALALQHNLNELSASEERYRNLVTSMRDGILQASPDGAIDYMNPAGLDILGFDAADEIVGTNLQAFFQERGEGERIVKELSERHFVDRTRTWLQRSDGRAICVEWSANIVLDDQDEVAGIEGLFRDVTKNVRLEEEAKERSARIAAINQIANVINSSLEAGRLYESLVVEVKRLIDFDYAALTLLTPDGQAFQTRQLWPHFEERPSQTHAVDDETACAGWVAKYEKPLLVGDLTALNAPLAACFPKAAMSCLGAPLYSSGRIIGTLELASNRPGAYARHDLEVMEQLTPHVAVAIRNAQLLENLQLSLEEVTRAREDLHQANEELKTLDEMKTNLLSNVSHELRTPLVAVMGYTDMIANGKAGPVTDTQKEYLGISLRNIDRLVTLIENLLDFSRLNRGAETLVFDTIDLCDCARGSYDLMQPVAEAREIRMVFEAPGEPVLIEGDKGKLGQVFNNLLSNAIKFNHSGGNVTIHIEVRDGVAHVAVSDTGIGIPEEARDKVFTRFYQFDSSSTRKYGGTGIGLAIAQDIVRLHGSRIVVASSLNEGSTFSFSLPLSERVRGDGGAEAPALAETQQLVELVSRDRALLLNMRNILDGENIEILSASNGDRAIALAERHHPDCIIVDGETRDGKNGVLTMLANHPVTADIPRILLSSDDAAFEQYRSLVAARVKRGFRKSTLLSSIAGALGKPSAKDAPLGNGILCVDDDKEILTYMARSLETEGYQVAAVESGEAALSRAASREFGLVLLDIAMPGMDGWETCRHIKDNPSLQGIKVFLVTAKPIESARQQYREVGADGYMLKPFRADDLLELVRGVASIQVQQEI